tara:strand:+ start:1098 stop:2876 length:1779 start_codon:yes stop_codon:yes gene_type:complete
MSRVRDKADFQFAGEDYTHGAGVKYVANMIQTTDLDASGTISNIHLQDIADVAAVSASNDGYYLKYDHATTSFAWSQVSGGGGGTMNDVIDDTTPQLGGTLDANSFNIDMGNNIITDTKVGYWDSAYSVVSSGGTIGGNLTITGNFVVNGTTTTINTQNLLVSDNIITLNSDVTGTPSQNAGVAVERGTSSNVDIRWNETTDKWQFTNDGTTYEDIGAGGDVVDDLTPQLGGDLDVNGNTIDYTFSLVGSSSPNYRFSDPGSNFFDATTSNPTLYLTRGVKYIFKDISGSHPFRIQSTNSVGGTLYNVGVTNNNGTGTVTFTPTMTAPDELYYYCNAHSSMNGTIKIVGEGGSTGDITFSGSTMSSSGTTITVNDNLSVTGSVTSTQAGSPIISSASSLTLEADTTSRVIVSQSPLRLYNVSTTDRNNITMADGDLVYDSDLDKAYVAQNGSWGQLLTSNGFGYVGSVIEVAGSSTTVAGTLVFYMNDYQLLRLTQDQTADRTLYITGDSGTQLSSSMATNEVRTLAVAWKNGSTPYYINTVQIDGSTQTVKYEGGTAPTAGNASSIDFYTFSIIKTGSSSYEVYGTFTKFA